MLTAYDIDELKRQITMNGEVTAYYLASRVERREGFIDEIAFKSKPSVDIVEVKIKDVSNALWELLNFKQHPTDYHTESETVVIDHQNRYTYYYTVPNGEATYDKPFNPRMPSAIYGCRRVHYKGSQVIGDYNDPSPITPVYTNVLTYWNYPQADVLQMFNDGAMDWKYRLAPENTEMDGIVYKYMTSNWFILEVSNFPRTEHHLICTKQKNAFFASEYDALLWKEQLI